MIAIGGGLAILQSETAIFDAIAAPGAIGLVGGLLMLVGVVVVSIVALKQRSATA